MSSTRVSLHMNTRNVSMLAERFVF